MVSADVRDLEVSGNSCPFGCLDLGLLGMSPGLGTAFLPPSLTLGAALTGDHNPTSKNPKAPSLHGGSGGFTTAQPTRMEQHPGPCPQLVLHGVFLGPPKHRGEERAHLGVGASTRGPKACRQRHALVGVLAEDVLDDDDGLLHHVVDFGLDEVEQGADAALGRLLRRDTVSQQRRSSQSLRCPSHTPSSLPHPLCTFPKPNPDQNRGCTCGFPFPDGSGCSSLLLHALQTLELPCCSLPAPTGCVPGQQQLA